MLSRPGHLLKGRRRAGGGGPPGVPVATIPGTVLGRWSANHSTVTTASGRVESATATAGVGAGPLQRDPAAPGPLELTDALGRKFWRFDNTAVLQELVLPLATRNCAIIMVGRRLSKGPVSPNYFSFGNAGTAPSTNGAMLRTTSSNASHYIRGGGVSPATGERWKVIHGFQNQVFGVSCGATSSIWQINNQQTAAGSAPFSQTATGFELARNANAPEISGDRATFDLYELVLLNTLSSADMNTAWANLQAAYGIANITDQLLLEGDSITFGWTGNTPPVLIGEGLAEILGAPGGAHALPGNWRIVSSATSGNETSHVIARRDLADGMSVRQFVGGRNVMSLQIGVNESPDTAGKPTSDQLTTTIAGICNTAVSGYLQKGWECLIHANIACGNVSIFPGIAAMQTKLMAPAFLTACDAQAGGTYAGKVIQNPLHLWQVGGATVFEDQADAGNNTYYQTDGLHPTPVGTVEYAKSVKAALGL